VAKNECDVAIVNHYYYAMMLQSKDAKKRKIANKVDIAFLNQKDRGAHVNISGIGIMKYSKNIANAEKLIIFLLNKDSQEWYAKVNNEYPVLEASKVTDLLATWGVLNLDEEIIGKLGSLNPDAVKLMDRVGWQ
jgi:iron(III) transport system substrate-binding protein